MTSAVIAEDEALLAEVLAEQLSQVWPELRIAAFAPDGEAALAAIRVHRPDVVFLDIRMPGRSGLEVAQALAQGDASGAADEASGEADYAPLVVFVTAYDQYAIDAFESAAADYLLKPVSEERLTRCVARVRARLAQRAQAQAPSLPAAAPSSPAAYAAASPAAAAASPAAAAASPAAHAASSENLQALQQLVQALAGQLPVRGEGTRLRFIRASLGDVIRQIPVDDVLYLEAQDKYVAVITRDATALVRTPLSELLAALDPDRFVQIHRSTVVRVDAIDTIRRDLTGRQFVHLRERAGGREVKLPVSRQYAGQFRGL